MAGASGPVNNFLTCSQHKWWLSLVKGFRNGAVLNDMIRVILRATYTHSKNLASFVLVYKSLKLLLLELGGKPAETHSFIAAFIGGYLVWGQYNKVNEQINLYLLSRILYGLIKLAVDKGLIPRPRQDPFPIFAALVWATVLWLFEHHQHTLQPSLQSSMTYLYHDSNTWHGIWDFLIYNK